MILSENHQFSRSENFEEFHSKSLDFTGNHRSELLSYRAPKDTNRKDFVHTFKFLNSQARQSYLHVPVTPYIPVKNMISTFSPLSLYIAKLLKKYSIKTFLIALTLFFSKTPEKVGFLKKKVRTNPTHTALCGGVPN